VIHAKDIRSTSYLDLIVWLQRALFVYMYMMRKMTLMFVHLPMAHADLHIR